MTITKRKGARSIKEIPKEILTQLNNGEIETANLVEWLAVNPKLLLENVLVKHKLKKYLQPILVKVDALTKSTVNTVNETIGIGLFELATQHNDDTFLTMLAAHPSDVVRCWATYTVSSHNKLTIKQILKNIQPFAADAHFGVREIAWLSVRKHIAANLNESLQILTQWAKDKDANIRRFASEATRPRGVWCEHIELLKQQPALGLPILEPLKSDAALYVQNSVANWLNDASKTQPNFVITLCKKWQKESNTKETAYIIKKALRTVEKNKE
jgi:3-methyladenine DNA glycosylase AlkC